MTILDFPKLINSVADELFLNLDNYRSKGLRTMFLINRRAESEMLSSRLFEVNNYGGNVLVVGEPGVGKSVFLNNFLKNSLFVSNIDQEQLSMIDLREHPYNPQVSGEFIELIRNSLGKTYQTHLNKLGDPCHDASGLSGSDLFNYGASKFMQKGEPLECPEKEIHYLFLDDVDYLPDEAFDSILEDLRPMLISQYFCVILACRVPAYNAIQAQYDTNISNPFLDSRKITLKPLDVHSLLEARLQDLFRPELTARLALQNCKLLSFMKRIRKTIEECLTEHTESTEVEDSPEEDESEDASNTESEGHWDIDGVQYPFTYKQHQFMANCSNGNIRQVLRMAQAFLREMARVSDKLVDTGAGYRIGRRSLLDLFSSERVDDRDRIYNVNHVKSLEYVTNKQMREKDLEEYQKGNSIDVILLETISECQYPHSLTDSTIKSFYGRFGITTRESEESIRRLLELRMIRKRMLETRVAFGVKIPKHDYELTSKGMYYYSYMIHWDAYIDRFSSSKHKQVFNSSATVVQIETELLKIASNFGVFVQEKYGELVDFKINRVQLRDYIQIEKQAFLLWLNETNRKIKLDLTVDFLKDYLVNRLGICEKRKSDESKNFLFLAGELLARLEERRIPLKQHDIFDAGWFRDNAEAIIKIPEE